MRVFRVLLVLGKGVLLLVGPVMAIVLFTQVLSDTHLFLNPKYKSFWIDVEEYHSNPNERKAEREYVSRYGFDPVSRYMMNPGASAAYLPSEEVAKTSVKWSIVYEKKRNNYGSGLIATGFLFVLVVGYLPIAYAARQVQRVLARMVCFTSKAAEVRTEYFAKFSGAGAFWSTVGAFTLALVMAVINSVRTISPEDQIKGVTVLDLAGALLFVGYFSGLWVRLVSQAVAIGFIAFGRNPHKSIWDNVITLAVTAPVLLFIYNNSWLAVLTASITGLAGELFAKWSAARRDNRKPDSHTSSSSASSVSGSG